LAKTQEITKEGDIVKMDLKASTGIFQLDDAAKRGGSPTDAGLFCCPVGNKGRKGKERVIRN
jgi:hypothetical protein